MKSSERGAGSREGEGVGLNRLQENSRAELIESSARNGKRPPPTMGISLQSQGTTRLMTNMVAVATPRLYWSLYVRVLISLWLFIFPIFLFAPQPEELFLDGLKKLEQRSHKYVELRINVYGKYRVFNPVACCFLYKAKDFSAHPRRPLESNHTELLRIRRNPMEARC
jgi:hypothetical protein